MRTDPKLKYSAQAMHVWANYLGDSVDFTHEWVAVFDCPPPDLRDAAFVQGLLAGLFELYEKAGYDNAPAIAKYLKERMINTTCT